MINPESVPLKEFDEAACLSYIKESETLIDAQLLQPWAWGEFQRIIKIPDPSDIRYYIRLRQQYENAKWVVGELFFGMTSGEYWTVFFRSKSVH